MALPTAVRRPRSSQLDADPGPVHDDGISIVTDLSADKSVVTDHESPAGVDESLENDVPVWTEDSGGIEVDIREPVDIEIAALIPTQRQPTDDLIVLPTWTELPTWAELPPDPPPQDRGYDDHLVTSYDSTDDGSADTEFYDPDLNDAELSNPPDEMAAPPGGRHRQPRRPLRHPRAAVVVAVLLVAVAVAALVTVVIWRGDELRPPFGGGGADGASDAVLTSARERQSVTGTVQPIRDLPVASCFQDLPDGPGPYSGVEVVSCADAHDNQLVAVFELADREWPGDLVIADEAQARCRDIGGNVVERAGPDPAEWDFWVLVPTRQGWVLNDDRVGQCMVYDPAGPVEGDILS